MVDLWEKKVSEHVWKLWKRLVVSSRTPLFFLLVFLKREWIQKKIRIVIFEHFFNLISKNSVSKWVSLLNRLFWIIYQIQKGVWNWVLVDIFCIRMSLCNIRSIRQVSISRLEKLKTFVHTFMYVKASLHLYCVCCLLVHAKIGFIHGVHNLYVIELFMNAHNLLFTLNIFFLF